MRLWLSIAAVAGIASWVYARLYSTSTVKMGKVAPVIALSHGGAHASIATSLRERVPRILSLKTPDRPRAIVLITAHWTTPSPTVSVGASPSLYYDYYGFPDAAYAIKYPASGSPGVAAEVIAALEAEGLTGVTADAERGWDHGVFIPLKIAEPDPEAIPPIVQMSVLASEDAETHLRMGRALRSLRESNVAIVGSGFASLHNTRLMVGAMRGGGKVDGEVLEISKRFNQALGEAVGQTDEKRRWDMLGAWRDMPGGQVIHPPRAGEHFLPLLVAAGAVGEGERARFYKDEFVGVDIYTYYWGEEEA